MYPLTPGNSGLPDCHKKVLDEYCRARGVAAASQKQVASASAAVLPLEV